MSEQANTPEHDESEPVAWLIEILMQDDSWGYPMVQLEQPRWASRHLRVTPLYRRAISQPTESEVMQPETADKLGTDLPVAPPALPANEAGAGWLRSEIMAGSGIEYDADADVWWLPAEPGPLAFDTLREALARSYTLKAERSDDAALRAELEQARATIAHMVTVLRADSKTIGDKLQEAQREMEQARAARHTQETCCLGKNCAVDGDLARDLKNNPGFREAIDAALQAEEEK